jgi:putative transposase
MTTPEDFFEPHRPRRNPSLRRHWAEFLSCGAFWTYLAEAFTGLTQGKIERWHQTLENRILLETTSCPVIWRRRSRPLWRTAILRYHESLSNLTPADICLGRGETNLMRREKIKRRTLQTRRLQHQMQAAQSETQMDQRLL